MTAASPRPAPSRRASRAGGRTLGALGAAGVAGAGYAWCEARWFALRHVEVPVLPAGAAELRVLHLSDLHLVPRQRRKVEWVRSLAALEPDLVVNTGDSLASPDAVGVLLDALGRLLDAPGVFVLGSNDYFAPSLRNPARYLLPDDGSRNISTPELPWRSMVQQFGEAGWLDLSNRRDTLTVRGTTIAFTGVDDPHLEYDDLAAVAGAADPTAGLRMGVAHAPYLRVLDRFAADGNDLILAGHTHGGQIRVPFRGALVTNCDLEPARASGLHRHPADSAPDDPGSAWLHVSAGAGTSPYAVARFACRPEATLLRLTPRG